MYQIFLVLVSQKPAANSDVYIPRGIWMVIDYPLPVIRSLRIDGVLEFEQVWIDNYTYHFLFLSM